MKNMLYALRALIYFTFIRLFRCKNFKFTHLNLLYPRCVLELDRKAKAELGVKFSARYNNLVNVRGEGNLKIGDNVFFNANCVVTCHGNTKIGDNCKFGPGTMLFDHDHNMSDKDAVVNSRDFANDSITIGKNCWFGAGCIILKGTVVGDNCVFGAGSIVKGTYADNSIVVQKRTDTVRTW